MLTDDFSRHRRPLVIVALLLLATSWGVWQAVFAQHEVKPESPAKGVNHVSVEVIAPLPGGITRRCLQPGTIEPIESADLYSKVSGFLAEQNVDIGDHVHAGDMLARIAVPEYETQVKQDQADVTRAEAKVEQMQAAILFAKAGQEVAAAEVALARAEKKSKIAHRNFREKQRDRIRDLVARMAIDGKLADEHEDQYQAALSAELAAEEAIRSAQEAEAAARAKVQQAFADLKYATAEVETAKARVEKAKVMLDYAVIRSPYTGIITRRNFHRGDFIRSADTGGERVPLLAVERTDIMRVVIQIPERDVPLVNRGDPAVVEVDALPGVVFASHGKEKVEVSRIAGAEDPHTRMMRAEVHIPNSDAKLRHGMFGKVALHLEAGAPAAFRIPSAALARNSLGNDGTVRVVRNGEIHSVPVTFGADNGAEVEVILGLKSMDRVIVRAHGALEEGAVLPDSAITTR